MEPEITNENQQTTEVTPEEQPKVDLAGVEVMSNGQVVDIAEDHPEDTDEQIDQEAESKETAQQVQEELKNAKASMEQAKATLESKGVDYKTLEAEYNDNGELSPESYKTLENAGYPKEVVDAIIAGWQAKADNFTNAVIDSVGGQSEYDNITKFVSSQGEQAVAAFNDIVGHGDLNVITSYLAGVKAQMVSKYGTQNPTLTGRGVTQGSPKGFANQSEMIKAINDKRYTRDPEYTKEVEKRIQASSFM